METIESGLRRIKTRSDNVHRWKWTCALFALIGTFSAPAFPPLAIFAFIGVYLWIFLLYRLAFSSCPRCSKRFYCFVTIFFNMSYYTKSGMYAVECNHCKLKLSELPEVEEVEIKSNKDEWLK